MNKLKSKKILYVYTGDHPVHRSFAETITKKSEKYSRNLSVDYDVYFCEGIYAQPILMRNIKRINPQAKIISLFADPRLYYLDKRVMFDYDTEKLVKMPRWKALFSKKILKRLDGAICEGGMNFELFRKWNKKSPAKIIYPYVDPIRFGKLSRIKPKLNNHKILFVGNGPDEYCKGLRVLVKAFAIVRKEIPDAELYVYGSHWDEKKFPKVKGLKFFGKKDISLGLKEVSLLAHIGQGEGFGINIMDSMLAGVPTIVSEGTGARDLVNKVDPNYVVKINEEEVAQKIIQYFKEKPKRRQELSKSGRKLAKHFDRKSILKDFKRRFIEVLGEIYG
jgi:glycosyltransferase involved in cell wall biosynthesis